MPQKHFYLSSTESKLTSLWLISTNISKVNNSFVMEIYHLNDIYSEKVMQLRRNSPCTSHISKLKMTCFNFTKTISGFKENVIFFEASMFNKKNYYTSWNEAQVFCQSLEAVLPTVRSRKEMHTLLELTKKGFFYKGFYLGTATKVKLLKNLNLLKIKTY